MNDRRDLTRIIEEGLGPECSFEDADHVYCYLRRKNKIWFSHQHGLVLDDDVDLLETLLEIERAELTEADMKAIRYLRSRGFAVTVFTPEELGGVDPEDVQNSMVHHGQEAIDELKHMVDQGDAK